MKWPIATWSEVLDIKNGKSQKNVVDPDGLYPIFGSGGQMGYANDYLCEPGTTIIGRKGSINSPIFVREKFWNVDTAFGLCPKESRLNNRFLYHFCIQYNFLKHNKATTLPSLTKSDLLEIQIPLPPLAEQYRIAAILDKADAIRRKLQQSLRLSDDFLRSVFLDMFGSDKTPKCDRVPLGPFLEFMTSGGRGWSQYYAPNGARFIRSLDVQMNEIGEKDVAYVAAPNNAEAKRTRVQENDVLLTITGSLIGRVARIPKEHAGAYISQHVAILRLGKGLDPEFLARFLSMDEGQRLVQKSQYGQTKPGLNFDQIRRFTVPLPSATLQKRFVEIANRVNASSMKSRTFMSQSETLFSSLQQRAFRGEL